jgi:hypothetical protein
MKPEGSSHLQQIMLAIRPCSKPTESYPHICSVSYTVPKNLSKPEFVCHIP